MRQAVGPLETHSQVYQPQRYGRSRNDQDAIADKIHIRCQIMFISVAGVKTKRGYCLWIGDSDHLAGITAIDNG